MKIDVEGAELLVLKGAAKFIREFQPVIFLELLRKWSANFDYHPNEAIALLEHEDYSIFAVEKDLRQVHAVPDNETCTNFLALPKDRYLEGLPVHG